MRRTEVLMAVTMASAAAMACVVDSLMRRQYLDRSFQFVSFYLWPVALPAYLVVSRGKRGWWVLFKVVLGAIVAGSLGTMVSALT